MKTVVFAYHTIGVIGLKALKRHKFDIQAVFSHEDNPDESIWFDSVAEWATKNRIPLFCPPHVNCPEWIEKIHRISPEVIFSFYYRNLLGREILSIPPSGAYNLHGSLLPAYRGRCPVNWVLIHGEERTGITLHHMVEQADAGDIVGQKEVVIRPKDTAFTLYQKLCRAEKEVLDEMLPLIKVGRSPRMRQDLKAGSYFGGRRPEDGKIDWHWSVMRIHNMIRAVTKPYPGAFTFSAEGQKIFIWWAFPERVFSPEGRVGAIQIEKGKVYVSALDGRTRLMDIEVGQQRMKGRKIFEYFENREGMVLE